MPKRENESDRDYKARKKAKKEAKKKKKAAEKEKTDKKEEKTDKETESSNATTDENKNKEEVVPATTTNNREFTSFADAPYCQSIQKAFQDAGFKKPSPIQAKAWPIALAGKDLIAVAKTGSGKTLGFLLPILHRIINKDLPGGATISIDVTTTSPSPHCLILSPTRELAIQIHRECIKFGSSNDNNNMIRAECVYGGTNIQQQIKNLRVSEPHVVIATAGRLCDLLDRGSSSGSETPLSLHQTCFCVLDEADRMLDMGFEKQLNQIMDALPETRQTLFFTATWPKNVRRCATRYLRSEETVEIFIGDDGSSSSGDSAGELAANKAVTQTFVEAQDDEKDRKLYDLLCTLDHDKSSVVIFANTKRRVDFVTKTFWNEGFSICSVHGDKAQHERDAALQKFKNQNCSIMVATDVAARGLDIKGVTHVINFDMARDVESYVHRIGRTGRAGNVGNAITFWNPDYDKPCTPALITIAKNAGQEIPPFLSKFGKIKANKQWKVADAQKMAKELTCAA